MGEIRSLPCAWPHAGTYTGRWLLSWIWRHGFEGGEHIQLDRRAKHKMFASGITAFHVVVLYLLDEGGEKGRNASMSHIKANGQNVNGVDEGQRHYPALVLETSEPKGLWTDKLTYLLPASRSHIHLTHFRHPHASTTLAHPTGRQT